ncbi:VacJ family lipoprotein [Albirhodobacter sp. R86504]|jgi:phospholipid-binding lipoprotein MlaA|uniref:MlaA family lipoprotein n=1 Tax=Albirhodobacter sp. R86504 TaxID=3093848 RepID=UPI00366BDE81
MNPLRALPMTAASAALLGLAACAPAPAPQDIDRYEQSNRKMHQFNKDVDTAIFGNVDGISPTTEAVFEGVGRFSDNLSLPGKVVNSLLQGRPEPAIKNTFRFAINSTLGLAGIFDPAGNDFSLPETDTDFGETLHVWGAGEGDFIELPIKGPSTERDTVGLVVDFALDPLGNTLSAGMNTVKTTAFVGSKVGDRLRYDDTIDSLLYESADSYAQTKLLYLQARRYQLGTTAGSESYDPYDDPYEQ